MTKENDKKNKNSIKSNNRFQKIIIKSYIAHIWLNKLYIDIKKRVFFNTHKQPDVIEYQV